MEPVEMLRIISASNQFYRKYYCFSWSKRDYEDNYIYQKMTQIIFWYIRNNLVFKIFA